MWLTGEEQQIIDIFWDLAGEVEPFPRTLERAIALALPIAVVKMPRLALGSIETWLRSRQIPYSFNCESRFVRGCLISYGGKGFIFCDGTDPSDEIHFTLAHEVGHFLADYWYPRQKAVSKFGAGILDVFDGIREPTVTERIQSVFESTRIGVCSNLMNRDDANEFVWTVEDKADKIGFGLLAPPQDVLKGIKLSQSIFLQRQEHLSTRLIHSFGLPAFAAKTYSNILLRHIGKGPSWAETLRVG